MAPFLADLCHQVRTPLNGILGTLELLLDGDLTDDARELARVAYDSAMTLHDTFEMGVVDAYGADAPAAEPTAAPAAEPTA